MTDTPKNGQETTAFGVDIGGSGIKGALVDLRTGEFIGDRIRLDTPQPATPQAVADTVAKLLDKADWTGPVGITVPAVVRNQIARTAANIDPAWIGTDCQSLFGDRLTVDGAARPVSVLNDADAAGIAETAYGDSADGENGTVLFLTFGTGIGSALIYNGTLFPNSELGHLNFPAMDAEKWASSAVRDQEKLSFKEWSRRVDRVLHEYVRILNPSRIIVGGGISKKHHKWVPELTVDVDVVPATLLNRAGIVGAAMAATHGMRP
ncbi:polyphosphate--glucose phosphotransferase [Corynebacterium sp. AOP40-9SA-29]|uniref:polyphosphate--glucose phosphotransferase n=1 Tax=Corynebacterium sp. AOP40-9SA-29 TaxID=3457677 RepID=UPI0040338143